MAIFGFNFTKIGGQRVAPIKGKVNISNNVALLNVSDANVSMGDGRKGLRIHFAFDTKFEPKIGQMHFEGDLLLVESAKVAEDVLKVWTKDKNIPQPIVGLVLNQILEKCNIQAILMARDLNLPTPVPLPKANSGAKPKQALAKGPEKKPAPKKSAKK